MINKNPKTYNEIIRLRKCYTLANYYTDITEEIFEDMYNFLAEDDGNSIIANQTTLLFVNKANSYVKRYLVTPKNNNFERIVMDYDSFLITNRYDSYHHSSWSGSSGNNNNNNNNNNS